MDLRIVPMTEEHLGEVLRIEQQVSGIPWSRQLFAEELRRGDDRRYRVAMAADSDQLFGYLGMLYIVDEAHIATVGVDPDHWGHGVATHLVLDALEAARAEKIKDCTLEVRSHNERAKRLYQRFGFAPVALRRGYYHDNGEDAIIMWLYDLDAPTELARRQVIADELGRGGPALV